MALRITVTDLADSKELTRYEIGHDETTEELRSEVLDAIHDAVLAVCGPDVEVENHGSIVLVRLCSAEARDFVKTFVSEEAQFFGDALVVEPRYVEDLTAGMIEHGLVVK
jgi:hypothetical protein